MEALPPTNLAPPDTLIVLQTDVGKRELISAPADGVVNSQLIGN